MIHASICTIGDEILIGQIVDTNSSHIAVSLGSIGVGITRMVSISDNHNDIINQLDNELHSNDIVIVTGGLGPTKDDITKEALRQLSGSTRYVRNDEQAAIVTRILHSRGLDTLEINLKQAEVPEKCRVIPNRLGTAPVMSFHFEPDRYGHKAILYSMPGVPYETLGALPDVIDDIKHNFKLDNITHKTIMTYGMAESALAVKIAEWEESLSSDGIHLAYLPNTLTGVRLRMTKAGGDMEHNLKLINAAAGRLRPILGNIIYSEQDSTLQHTLGVMLRGSGNTVSCAESCTGGMISHLITTVPGSSEYYLGSVTSYSPLIKESVLGVSAETIRNKGIVSSEVAAEMAEGVKELTGSTFAVSTTGWADNYGDEHEPAGTVWVGISGPHGTKTRRFEYHADRCHNIERFAASALNCLRLYIIDNL